MPPPPSRSAGRVRTGRSIESASSGPSDQLRRQIDRWADEWLPRKFARGLALRATDPGPFNYPVEVFSEWRGKVFYMCARYRARSRRPEDDFIVRSARMTLTGFGRFDLAYFRHTGRWFTVSRGRTAAACFAEIEGNDPFVTLLRGSSSAPRSPKGEHLLA